MNEIDMELAVELSFSLLVRLERLIDSWVQITKKTLGVDFCTRQHCDNVMRNRIATSCRKS